MKKIFVFIFAGISIIAHAQTKTISGFTTTSAANQLVVEQNFDANLSSTNLGHTLKVLSSKPHHIGSPGDKENAEYILNLYKSFGWDAKIETFKVLFPTPKTRVLEMISPTSYKALLKEPAIGVDSTSGQDGQLPTYNAWSADGDVTGDLVFVNYGMPADYEQLEKLGIDVKGKIVIAKYGRCWRGIKPKVAQEHGAIGCIIYSDPKDDGYYQGDVYPDGAFKNEYGVQRGSVLDMVIYPGDPLTPGIGATEDAKRLTREDATNLLKIPVLPISYHDAEPLLKALSGPVAPADWRGALPFTYHIGPGKTKVHLQLAFNWDMVECNDVIANIKGSELPDEWVVRGNHYDAWVNGASDPISGQSSLLEEAKSIGIMLKNGWKPKRTLIYCSWDGEEPGLLGSTEWLETHIKELQQKAVIYINSDGNGRGFLGAGGSHALENFVGEIAKNVTDPQTKVSVYDRLMAGEAVDATTNKKKEEILDGKGWKLDALGSGSDYSSFLQHAGITTLDLGYGGEDDGGEYHSIYDSYYDYTHFKDPGFQYGVTLSQTVGRTVLRMADADVLPFDFRNLYTTINGYVKELMDLLQQTKENTAMENKLLAQNDYMLAADPTKPFVNPKVKTEVPYLDFSALQNAMESFQKATDSLNATWKYQMNKAGNTEAFNELLYKAEQQLLTDGLPRRTWYKHNFYAPGFYTVYGVKTLPGIREAIEQRNWKEAQAQIIITANVVNSFSAYLMQAAASK
jgi:N-acetylated-alpha-linked acidic dipeptidase